MPLLSPLMKPWKGSTQVMGKVKTVGEWNLFENPGPIAKFERMQERWLQIVHSRPLPGLGKY